MQYEIKTHRGITFSMDSAGLDLKEYTAQLNNRALRTIALADMVLSKSNIKIIAPVGATVGEGYKTLHTVDGETYKVNIENYDALDISNQFNDMSLEFILLGNIIVNKNSFDLLI